MEVKIEAKDYFEELKYMKQQYGQEEDLYPWIYMMLKVSGVTDNFSMRQVAGASWSDKIAGRELLRGYAAFPDIAILEKDFLAVDMERIKKEDYSTIHKGPTKQYIKDQMSKKRRKYIKPKDDDILTLRDEIKDFNIEKVIGCVEAKDTDKKLLDLDETITEVPLTINITEKYIVYKQDQYKQERRKIDSSEEFYNLKTTFGIKNLNERPVHERKSLPEDVKNHLEGNEVSIQLGINGTINIGTKSHNLVKLDVVELFGELLWYGKVLYTNGMHWKYLEVKECKSKDEQIKNIVDLRKLLYSTCVKDHDPEKIWYEQIAELQNKQGLEIKISCKTFSVSIKSSEKDQTLIGWLKECWGINNTPVQI